MAPPLSSLPLSPRQSVLGLGCTAGVHLRGPKIERREGARTSSGLGNSREGSENVARL